MTFLVTRQDLVSSITAEGIVEAQRQLPLQAPRLRETLPQLSFLSPEFSYVRKGDVAMRFNDEEIRVKLEQAERNLETVRSDLAKLDAEQESRIAQLEAQVRRAEASMQSSRLKLAELEFVAPREREIRELQIRKSGIEAAKSRKKLDSISQVHKKERSQFLLRIKQEQSKVGTERSNMEQLVLEAPVDGYVLYHWNFLTREFFKPGDPAIPGGAVVSIADISTVQIKLQLSETEVQRMAAGQVAEITIESLGGLKLSGRVIQVAQVAKPVRRNSAVKKVEVVVAIDTTAPGLVPGLSASCTVIKEHVEDAVVVPLETVFDRDSAKVVYAFSGGEFSVRQVELGAKSADFAVVLEGLDGGEQLALREPDRSLIAGD